MAIGALAMLAACSWVPDSVNPISWYRDLSGASKNDALDKDQRNQQNLEAGGKAPYPNLGDVPDAPDRARGAIDRDALQKSLAADRANAHYTNDQLRADATTGARAAAPGEDGILGGGGAAAGASPSGSERTVGLISAESCGGAVSCCVAAAADAVAADLVDRGDGAALAAGGGGAMAGAGASARSWSLV